MQQRTRRGRRGCNPRVPCAGSLSLGRKTSCYEAHCSCSKSRSLRGGVGWLATSMRHGAKERGARGGEAGRGHQVGHLVYSGNGPVLLIRAEEKRVLFGFWRGQRLRKLEPRLKAGGKYEMATLELRAGDMIEPKLVRTLVRDAVGLNQSLGDPTAVARK